MAYNEALAERIRKSVGHLNVKEKKMFGSLAFLVNGKICLTAGPSRMMCRINPKLHEREVSKKGCKTVIMGGREYRGYIHVKEENLTREKDFNYWVYLALQFNRELVTGQN